MATNHEVGSSNLSGRANFPQFDQELDTLTVHEAC